MGEMLPSLEKKRRQILKNEGRKKDAELEKKREKKPSSLK